MSSDRHRAEQVELGVEVCVQDRPGGGDALVQLGGLAGGGLAVFGPPGGGVGVGAGLSIRSP